MCSAPDQAVAGVNSPAKINPLSGKRRRNNCDYGVQKSPLFSTRNLVASSVYFISFFCLVARHQTANLGPLEFCVHTIYTTRCPPLNQLRKRMHGNVCHDEQSKLAHGSRSHNARLPYVQVIPVNDSQRYRTHDFSKYFPSCVRSCSTSTTRYTTRHKRYTCESSYRETNYP